MVKNEMPKAYEAGEHEDAIYAAWEKSGFFNPDKLPGERKECFSMVLPPPNVTGTLHMGHAVMLAIEDIMIRFNRMRGKKTLWLPGTDHAAIATQAKVEKLLMKEGLSDPRAQLGREEFLKRVRKYANASHDTIVNQAKKMGASLDWSREAYTLDQKRSRAVNTVFKMMHEDGLIYRGNRIVNWCPRCMSTLADDEVEYREAQAKLYTFKYDKNFPISISTTRPETKLGDTAVAVHPQDERYLQFVGKTFVVDFVGKKLNIKIVADSGVDPAFGTGALGVTPSHSHIDAMIAQKNNLPFETVIGEDGCMTVKAGEDFVYKNVLEARELVVGRLKADGLLEKAEDTIQNLSVCYRCGEAIEPVPKLQWFIDVDKPFAFRASKRNPIDGVKDGQSITLKELMSHVVRSGQIKIVPERFVKTYFNWIDNLRDWNISRQIWFGHRVPVWYGRKTEVGDRGSEMGTCVGENPPKHGEWEQDPDTLDTWFSSGIWTFSTLGWPEETNDLRDFHPTSVLETGYDILFFWIARMILMTTYVLGEVPFKTVYLHGLVRDEQGRKMSKSLENVIDPLEMTKLYGADATRLSLVIGSAPGNDTKLSEEKVAGYRNFTNKLWNISRFVLSGEGTVVIPCQKIKPQTLADRWILSRLQTVIEETTSHLEKHEFSMAGEKLRDFTWGEFADWYLEIAKIQKQKDANGDTRGILNYILERLLVMWHPFTPFVTEAIWERVSENKLMIHNWPSVEQDLRDENAENDFEMIRGIIVAIRNIRSVNKVASKQKVDVVIVGGILNMQDEIIKTLARVNDLCESDRKPQGENHIETVVGDTRVFVSMVGLVGKDQEQKKNEKEKIQTQEYIDSVETKLADKEFLAKAPAQVVESMRQKLKDAKSKLSVFDS